MFEGTLDPAKDTQDLRGSKPWWFNNPKARFPFNNRGEVDVPVTFTQEQVDTKVAEAIATSKASQGPFYGGFAEEIKGHPSIVRYKSVEELAKGHLELEKKIGLKGLMVPTENSSDDVRNDFFKGCGRPDASDGYISPTIENLHEGLKSTSETDAKWFKDIAFSAGLSSKQHDAVYSAYMTLQSQRLTDYDKTLQDESNLASTALRGKWGANYDEHLALSNGLIKKFGASNADALMTKFGSDPAAIEFLHNLGSQLSEDKLGNLGGSNMGMHPEQAKVEINTLVKQIMETKQDDPIYQDLLKRKDALYKIAYPPKQTV